MGQIIRCPLVGTPCTIPITIEGKTFFLAEAEEPEPAKKRRNKAISEAIADGYKIRSALEEKGINAFTCKICEMIQTCAYGMADISQNNANVFMELGMMLALGKPTIILAKKGQEKQLKLPSNVTAIEIILFGEYLDIIDPLREVVQKLPPVVSPRNPIQDLEKIQPYLADELRKTEANIVKEFKESIAEAKLDTISFREEKKEIPPELHERLAGLEEKLEDMRRLGFTTDAKTASSRAHYFYNRGDYEEAIANLNWSLELDPNNPANLYNRGLTYGKLGRYDEALADYNRSLELRLDDPETLNNRGIIYRHLERYDDALADYNRSLELRPDYPLTLMNRGNTYADLKRYDDALADYNRSLELRPDHPDTLMNRGATYHDLERYDDALADFNRSLEIRPDDPGTLMNRGITYGKLERYDESLADYNRSLELRPDDPDTLTNQGVIYGKLERYDEALADFNRALEVKPNDHATLNNRGLAYQHMGKYDESLADLNHSLEIRPDDPHTLNNRGVTYSYLQRYDDALADYNRALQLKPDDAGTFYNLGCLFSLWQKTDDALNYLETAIDKDKKYHEMAKTDTDFNNIRDDPRFKKFIE